MGKFINDLYHQISNKDLYFEALTHPSYANENFDVKGDYQRLEFIGDSVFQICVSEIIYRNYPSLTEGEMSLLRAKLVREETLSKIAFDHEIQYHLRLGLGEEKSGGRQRNSLLCDVLEALFGALYLDQGLEVCKEYIHRLYESMLESMLEDNTLFQLKDCKTTLQELVQSEERKSVKYHLVKTTGPANQPIFEVEAVLDNVVLGFGKGSSKKIAEQNAANDALSKMATGKEV